LANIIQSTPSPFVWIVDETRVGCLTPCVSPKVIVSTKTVPGCVEIPQVQDAQLTLVAAISAFGDSTVPMFITKLKTVDKHGLGEEMLLYHHQYVTRSANKMFITKVLFIDHMNQIFLPRTEELRCRLKFQDRGFWYLVHDSLERR
jgi:hypothetical protein